MSETLSSPEGRRQAYIRHTAGLRSERGDAAGLREAVGGEFDAVGTLERELLIDAGLRRDSTLIDVGCGSGRLAQQLVGWFEGEYLGTDIVPEMLEFARQLVPSSPRWRFELVDGTTIPAPDAAADMVCFFSVLTHVVHEEAYRYLREAARTLRSGGQVVLSFLEFRIPSHWAVFETTIERVDDSGVYNQFLDREALTAFADHVGLSVEGFYDGDTPHIPIAEPIRWSDGRVMEGLGNLGQSVCILRR